MAIKIPASKIYSIDYDNSTKNRITNVDSIYKRATIYNKAPISDSLIANLYSINTEDNTISFDGSIEKSNLVFPSPDGNGQSKIIWSFKLLEHTKIKQSDIRIGYILTVYNYNSFEFSTFNGVLPIGHYTYFKTSVFSNFEYYSSGEIISIDLTLNARRESASKRITRAEFYIVGNQCEFEDIAYSSQEGNSANVYHESTNDFRQEETTLDGTIFKLSDAICDAYRSGRRTAILEVAQSDYYDESGAQIIGTNDRPVFENGDIVVPYRIKAEKDDKGVVKYKELPLVAKANDKTSAIKFVVVNNYISFQGIIKQRLEIIEQNPTALVYGVRGLGEASPNSVRTDAAVGLTFKKKITPFNSTSNYLAITSDFDDLYPWRDMEIVTDNLGNEFVKIPKFYSRVTKVGDGDYGGIYSIQISGKRQAGFSTLFVYGDKEIDYVLVGTQAARSKTISNITTVSSNKTDAASTAPLVAKTMAQMRTYCENSNTIVRNNYPTSDFANGFYMQEDIWIREIIRQLFTIEFATTNSQSIMRGATTYKESTPITDNGQSIKTPSGQYLNSSIYDDGQYNCVYRGIVEPWGNVFKYCDGIIFDNATIKINQNPATYKNYNSTDYVTISNVTKGGYEGNGAVVGVNKLDAFPLLFARIEERPSDWGELYFADGARDAISSANKFMYTGGTMIGGTASGLWCTYTNATESSASNTVSARLCWKPYPNQS